MTPWASSPCDRCMHAHPVRSGTVAFCNYAHNSWAKPLDGACATDDEVLDACWGGNGDDSPFDQQVPKVNWTQTGPNDECCEHQLPITKPANTPASVYFIIYMNIRYTCGC